MTKVKQELSKGDWIVHSRHGLGQVVGTDTKELLGDRKEFYVVKTNAVTYWLPISEVGSERIRAVESPETFQKALEIAAEEPVRLTENYRRRLAYIKEKGDDSSLLVKAALIRDMYARSAQKDVHINEKKVLEGLQQQFVNEWTAACEISADEAKAKLRKALKESLTKIKAKG